MRLREIPLCLTYFLLTVGLAGALMEYVPQFPGYIGNCLVMFLGAAFSCFHEYFAGVPYTVPMTPIFLNLAPGLPAFVAIVNQMNAMELGQPPQGDPWLPAHAGRHVRPRRLGGNRDVANRTRAPTVQPHQADRPEAPRGQADQAHPQPEAGQRRAIRVQPAQQDRRRGLNVVHLSRLSALTEPWALGEPWTTCEKRPSV